MLYISMCEYVKASLIQNICSEWNKSLLKVNKAVSVFLPDHRLNGSLVPEKEIILLLK